MTRNWPAQASPSRAGVPLWGPQCVLKLPHGRGPRGHTTTSWVGNVVIQFHPSRLCPLLLFHNLPSCELRRPGLQHGPGSAQVTHPSIMGHCVSHWLPTPSQAPAPPGTLTTPCYSQAQLGAGQPAPFSFSLCSWSQSCVSTSKPPGLLSACAFSLPQKCGSD